MYLRTARLDLDDYNNDTEDGCHITSMAGTWLAVVKGFGGLRIDDKNGADHRIVLNPYCPDNWQSLAFKIRFPGRVAGGQNHAAGRNDTQFFGPAYHHLPAWKRPDNKT